MPAEHVKAEGAKVYPNMFCLEANSVCESHTAVVCSYESHRWARTATFILDNWRVGGFVAYREGTQAC